MRKLLCAILVALLVVPVALVAVSAESLVDEDYILSDLMPNEDTPSELFELTDCEVNFNRDGSLTVKVTGISPSLKVTLAEGSLLHVGAIVDLTDPAYFALDFGVSGTATISTLIFHYTRKDKAAQDTVADLYMESMYNSQYAQYMKQSDGKTVTSTTALTNDGSYIVWDWGTYVSSDANKLFDDHRHQFTSIEMAFSGSAVGAEITFYTMAVVSDAEVEGLGDVRPEAQEPEEPEESSEEPEESSEEPAESSEEPAESSATPAESSEEPAESSTPATTSGSTSSTGSTASEEGNSNIGSIIGIIIAVVAVIVIAVVAIVVVMVKKKK